MLAIVLQLGISSAFFRFYFDAKEHAEQADRDPDVVLVHDGDVDGRARARRSSSPTPIAHWIGLGHDPTLVRAGAVGLWAQTNYQQLTALFRVEERSAQYAIASVANVLITVARDGRCSSRSSTGARSGSSSATSRGRSSCTSVLLAYRSEQLGLEFDRGLFRKMQHFGMPLVPSALALWAINFVDREFVVWYKDARRGRRVLRGGEDRRRDHVRDGRVPHRVAGVRVLDRGRPRREADVLVRPDVPADVRVVGRARARRARAVVGAAARPTRVPARREGRRAARVRGRGVRRLHRARDRQRPRAADAAELGRHRHRRGRERRPQLLARPARTGWSAPRSRRQPRTSCSSSA